MNRNNTSLLRGAVRRALLASTFAAAAGHFAGALAQEQTESASAAEAPLAEVVVTGSRLVRSRDFVASSPVQTITGDEISNSGNVTLEDTLNDFPQLRPDNTGTVNQSGGAGVLSADLRGLGAVRTLVLVDGRRFIPADVTGLVDLGTIPDQLVERVEILTGGASAVYGSDAIAGAVNFILKRDFEGANVRYQYGSTSRDDGQSHKVDLLLGMNNADSTGNITLHASYVTRDPVFMGDRAFSRQPLLADATGRLQPFGSGNIPGGLIGLSVAQQAQIQGVDFTNTGCPGPVQGVRFAEDGVPVAFCRPTDQYNYAAVNFLQRPLESWQISTLGHYEFSENVEAYAQLFYTKKQNEFQQAPEAVSPTSFGQPTGTVLITNADTNPLFPAATRDFFAANRDFFDPDGDGIFTVQSVSRRFEEFGPRNTSITSDSFNLTTGLRGSLTLGENRWQWDTFVQYARSDVEFLQQNLLSRSRTTLGLDAEVVDGEVRCRIDMLNCVPVNIFGTNTLTPEMANFLKVSTGRADEFNRRSAGASIAGDLFSLPAGPLSTAFGVEWRREEFSTLPDEVARSGDLAAQTVAPQPNGGHFELFEVFTEARFPLLRDLPGVRSLALEAAGRFSDYTTIGNVTTWKGALDWEVVDWFRLRGSYSRAIRAPNLDELFATPTAGFTGGRDPCWVTSNPTPEQRAFCVEQGVPADVIDTFMPGASQGWDARSGGNPDLIEESADTLTVGAVFTFANLNGLSVAIDYWDVEVEDAITQVASQLLVDSCFATLDPNSAACRSISRLPGTGLIDVVNAPRLNVASRKVSGIDLLTSYWHDLPDYLGLPGYGARLGIQLAATWQDEDITQSLPNLEPVDCAGRYEGACSGDATRITPDFRGRLRFDWRSGPLQIATDLQMIGSLHLAPGAVNENGKVGSELYVDLTARYDATDFLSFTVGAQNLLDNQPPILGFTGGGDSNTNIPLYDPLGRRYFVTANVKF